MWTCCRVLVCISRSEGYIASGEKSLVIGSSKVEERWNECNRTSFTSLLIKKWWAHGTLHYIHIIRWSWNIIKIAKNLCLVVSLAKDEIYFRIQPGGRGFNLNKDHMVVARVDWLGWRCDVRVLVSELLWVERTVSCCSKRSVTIPPSLPLTYISVRREPYGLVWRPQCIYFPRIRVLWIWM